MSGTIWQELALRGFAQMFRDTDIPQIAKLNCGRPIPTLINQHVDSCSITQGSSCYVLIIIVS